MSYIKNAADFGKLVGICAGYEGNYTPARQTLTVTSIRNLAAEAEAANLAVSIALQKWISATGQRREAFLTLKDTVKRLRAEIRNTETDQATKNMLIGAINKAAAFNRGVNTDPPAENTKPKHTYGTDFTTRLAAFEDAVNTLATTADYQPSYSGTTIVALKEQAAMLRLLNENVNKAIAVLNDARNHRRQVFENPDTGVFATAEKVKNVIKSIYGKPSDELKLVTSIRFIG